MPSTPFALNRRAFLNASTCGIGSIALQAMLAETQAANEASHLAPHHTQTAKSLICLFQHGGPSQCDLFDEKPLLAKYHGQPYPAGELEVHFEKQKGNVLGSPYAFRKFGEGGMPLSQLLPHTGSIADDLTLVRSMWTESVDHESALRLIHTGKFLAGLPTMGSWVAYALGTENHNLPTYVVLSDPGGLPVDGEKNWTSGWLPPVFQGTVFRSGTSPVLHLATPAGVSKKARAQQLDLLDRLNRDHLQRYPGQQELAARITNFEIAANMQTAVPAALDLSQETEATQKQYGLNNPATEEYGRRCLIARRLIERGVRFVQLFLSGQPWDTHSKNAESLKGLCARTDQPSAALVHDLKQRGLLTDTIVLWTGEFGRLPVSQGTDGRDHNRHAFSLWLAGGGFKSGHMHGATDDFGYKSVEQRVSVHDLHATLLHALGLDHERLTFPNEGRAASLTDAEVTGAQIVPQLLA